VCVCDCGDYEVHCDVTMYRSRSDGLIIHVMNLEGESIVSSCGDDTATVTAVTIQLQWGSRVASEITITYAIHHGEICLGRHT
jgi:hypothetical protein